MKKKIGLSVVIGTTVTLGLILWASLAMAGGFGPAPSTTPTTIAYATNSGTAVTAGMASNLASGASVSNLTVSGTFVSTNADSKYDAAGAGTNAAAGVQSNLTSHASATNNPHSVTAAQVGLGGGITTNLEYTDASLNTYYANYSNGVYVGNDPSYLMGAPFWTGVSYTPNGGEFTVTGSAVRYDVAGKKAYALTPGSVTSIMATNMGASITNLDGTLDGTYMTNWTTVADVAFYSAIDLVGASFTNVNLPHATRIGTGSFKGNSFLTSFTGTNLTQLDSEAFASCTLLGPVFNGYNVTNIASFGVFRLCSALTNFIVGPRLQRVEVGCFDSTQVYTLDLSPAGTNLVAAYLQNGSNVAPFTNININGCSAITALNANDGGGTNVCNATNASAYAIGVMTNANWIVNY